MKQSGSHLLLLSRFKVLSLIIIGLILLNACQEPYSIAELVDGPDGRALSLSPNTAVLVINNSLSLKPSGGIPPYEYSIISGGGTIVGSLFTAPPAPGTARIRVRDSAGNSSDAVYTVDAGGLGLGITPSTQTVSTGGSVNFAAIGGTGPYEFTLEVNNSGGSVNLSTGAYIAGSNSGGGSVNDTVRITDTADSSFAEATVTVEAKPLSISPSSITVYVNQSIDFSPVGGDGPFSFAILPADNNSGASIAGNTYTAGPTSGVSDVVTMTDAYDGRTRTATISVIDTATGVDYAPGAVGSIVSADLLAGSSFDAQFDIVHQLPGGADGADTIAWTLYASTDTSLGGTDDRITAAGTTGPLSAGGTTTVTVTGATWPSEAGSYYLLVEIAAEDDLAFANNRNLSATTTQIFAPLAITPAVAAIYTGQQVDFTVSGGTGSYSYSFAQSGSGSPSMSGDQYTAGASVGTDIIEVQDDTYPAWPVASATVTVSATPAPPAGTIEYTLSGFTANTPSPNAGSSLIESFSLANTGPDDGSASISWSAYLSRDNTAGFSAGDMIIDSGSLAALDGDDGAPGGTDETTQAISGSWPTETGIWYLKVRETADDETTQNEWAASAPFDVQSVAADVDYFVSDAPDGGIVVNLNDAVNATFIIGNQGSDPGSSGGSWQAYISADESYNAGDIMIDSGSFSGIASGGTSAALTINSGTWSDAGSWYLLVRLSSTEEVNTANNIRASDSSYAVTDGSAVTPDYQVSSVSMYAPFVPAGSSVSETFSVSNVGSDGAQNISWTAYASADTLPDGGEEIGSGIIGPLSAGGTLSNIPTLGAVWPAAGDYYLIIEATASDEDTGDQNDYARSISRFTVSAPPDYEVQSYTFPGEAEEGTTISGGFSIVNSGSGDGIKTVSWEAYLSFDQGFSGDDLLIGQGQIAPLTSGASSSLTAADLNESLWPNYGLSYLLIRVSADDDGNPSNDDYISGLTALYTVDREGDDNSGLSNDGSGSSTGPIPNTQNIGTLALGQTLVIRGWLDNSSPPSGGYDTYSFQLLNGGGVTTVSSYATWTANNDIGALYIWDELNDEVVSPDSVPFREPEIGFLSKSGWTAPQTGYVGIDSYMFVPTGNEYPYTIYIRGQ